MSTTINTYLAGTTVRLSCQFNDFNGNPVDPLNMKVTVYDPAYNVMSTGIVNVANKTAVGAYFYDYTIPQNTRTKLIYEWYGEISGNASIGRSSLNVKFV